MHFRVESAFDKVREWAYRAVRVYDDRASFGAAVADQVEKMNTTLQESMGKSEIRHIAKSITKWVWRHMANGRGNTSQALAAKQAELGRRSGVARRKKSGRLDDAMRTAVSSIPIKGSQRSQKGRSVRQRPPGI